MITNWSELHPSADIDWKPCFENFTCTILEVPLDYEDASVGTAAIAMLKVPALNQTIETKNILINPGGPGGSGVDIVMSAKAQKRYQDIFGPGHNIIGFDPRGVGQSTPNLDPFHGNRALAYNFGQQLSTNPSTTPSDFNTVFERNGAHGDLSKQELEKDAAYVGTPAVERDMLTIVEKLALSEGEKAEEAMLYYHGASYGSLLGGTFATLFPDRVGRMVVDAIADGDAYYSGNLSLNALFDTDAAERTFFTLCFEAGPSRCPYYANSSEAIETRYRKLLLQFKDNPIAVWDRSVAQIPTMATYGSLRLAFLQATYQAELLFPVLAQILADLEHRNGTSLLAFSGAPCYDCDESQLDPQDIIPEIGIMCTDADGRGVASTRAEWRERLYTAMSISGYAGDAMMGAVGAEFCRNWPFRPPPSQKFVGTFGGKTSTPLLVLSNTLDPVTPIRKQVVSVDFFSCSGN
ncbi:hypothetical protein N0V90_003382 [Kalmusia sp. IMI 367209]|nr:hypothetical protein N0V90_003382 [Kalmusia sp. IMI 367209]